MISRGRGKRSSSQENQSHSFLRETARDINGYGLAISSFISLGGCRFASVFLAVEKSNIP